MARVIIEIGQMSVEEGRAWADALVDKFGTDLMGEAIKKREAMAERQPRTEPEYGTCEGP